MVGLIIWGSATVFGGGFIWKILTNNLKKPIPESDWLFVYGFFVLYGLISVFYFLSVTALPISQVFDLGKIGRVVLGIVAVFVYYKICTFALKALRHKHNLDWDIQENQRSN